MKKSNFSRDTHQSIFDKHHFEGLVNAVKEAAQEEKRHSSNTLSQCYDIVAKHAGFDNWSLLMKTLDSVGRFQSAQELSYRDVSSRADKLGNALRAAVFKALPHGCRRFAEKDAYDLIAEDFSPVALDMYSTGDDAAIWSLKYSFEETYPSEALEHAIQFVLKRGPWGEKEIYFDEFYSGCID